jgi:hypothetical protein
MMIAIVSFSVLITAGVLSAFLCPRSSASNTVVEKLRHKLTRRYPGTSEYDAEGKKMTQTQ